ncbi:MAG: hypothetical protein M9894_20095 [Planctomycetes bacterium]|nr:hypothetical protein [Planctomycetota bacterium]
MRPPEPRAQDPQAGRGRIWVGLWGPAVVWLVHFLALYALAEFGCLSPLADRVVLGASLVAWLVLAVTAVCLALSGGITWLAWQVDQRLTPLATSGPEADPGPDAGRFAGRAGWMSGLLFTLIIAVEAVPVFFFLRDCGVKALP